MKRGIELSINFIVVLVIALVVFIFGIRFIYDLTSQASQLEGLTLDELDNRIGELLCESTDRVCIGIERRTISRKKFDIFGIKVINILDDSNFLVNVSKPFPSGYKKVSDKPINSNQIELKYRDKAFIKRNEEKRFGIAVEVPRNATPGTYIFDVNVSYYDTNVAKYVQYSNLHKFYVEVP